MNRVKLCFWMLCLLTFGAMNAAWAQSSAVSGTVTGKDKQPIPGVTIMEIGTSNGTITDVDGKFHIQLKNPGATLQFSFVGFQKKDIVVGNQTKINVVLEETVENLNQVVVVGYGTQKKKDVTTSMVSIKDDELTKEVPGNPATALQGKAAGVQVITSSGEPGAAPSVLVRGFTTINSGTSPLYVIDGVPVLDTDGNSGINFLSADEIESMEVLKDASAAAIYGTRASAGVILITTKRGKAGKPKFNFSYSFGLQSTQKPYDAMNSNQYAEAMNTAYANSDLDPLIDDTDDLNYTDWWKLGTRKTSPQMNASLSVSGGNEWHTYNMVFSYYKKESFYHEGEWQRFTARLNNDFKFAKWFKMGLDLNPRREQWDNTPDWYGDYLQIDPITPVYIPDDELTGEENEYSIYERSYYTYVWNPIARDSRQDGNGGDNYGINTNTYIQITPIKNLVLKSQLGLNVTEETDNTFNPEFTIDASHEYNATTNLSRKKITNLNWTWQNTATYNWELDKHRGSVMIGTTADEQKMDYVYGYAEGFSSTDESMRELDGTNGTVTSVAGNTTENTICSYFGRVTYNYDDRFMFTGTIRRDGSSKFMSNNKWATFPSLSGAWRITQEKFMKNLDFVSDLKLFGGWGEVGNQDLPSAVYLSKLYTDYTVFGDDEATTSTTMLDTYKNEDIKWETIEERNIGIDFNLFESAFTGSIEYYKKITHDMLFEKTYPYYSGFPSWGEIWSNIGSMQAQGIDVSLTYNYHHNNFKLGTTLTLSRAKMKMRQIDGSDEILGGPTWNSANTTRMVVGEEPGYFYGYKTDGIFQTDEEVAEDVNSDGDELQSYARAGDIHFVDLNGDGTLDSDDRTNIGSPYPDFTGGLAINGSYKANWGTVDLTANLYFSYGNDIVDWLKDYKYNAESQDNLADDAIAKAWHGEGTSNDVPILSYNDLNENFTKFSDYYVEDGSYLRLRNLQIGYSFPDRICHQLKLSKVRFYISGQNLFTITGYDGVNPETDFSPMSYGFQDYAYPLQKTYLVGLNLSF